MSFDAQGTPSPLAGLNPADAAIFLDFDGVLADGNPRSDGVKVAPEVVSLLAVLESETAGALAIVTSDDIADLRRHLPTVPQVVIGSHGAEQTLPGRQLFAHPLISTEAIAALHAMVVRATDLDGVVMERKNMGAVLHFRAAPHNEAALRDLCRTLIADHDGFEMVSAEHAFEIRPGYIDKPQAIAAAMAAPPFAGRVPVYVGLDTPDDPLLTWVAAQGGVALKVGPDETRARFKLPDAAAVQSILADWIERRWIEGGT